MSPNLIFSFLSAFIMMVFTFYVLRRYYVRRKLYFLFWGLGLAMFAIASFSEAYLALNWNRWAFYSWYLFGAVLTAAWIGQGTVHLLARKRTARISTIVLVAASVITAILLLTTMPNLTESIFSISEPISEQYKEIMPAITDGGIVRLATIPFNVYGTITLVGGALYSTYLFWRKRILRNRMIGNLLIAAGALTIASAGTLTRFGYGSYLYVGELSAAILMFSGFLVSTAPGPVRSKSDSSASAPA